MTSKTSAEMARNSRRRDGLSSWCKSCMADSARRWNAENAAKAAARKAEWQRQNADKRRLANRESYRRHAMARRAAIETYRRANPASDAARNRAQSSRRRARMAGVLVIPFTDAALAARIAYYGGKCWICKSRPFDEIDHVKPIKHGGPHILANLRPACRSCNASKNAAWPFAIEGARLGG